MMLKNYLKVAWRNIVRKKGFSFINITGLAIGMTVCLLILLFVQYELSYDTYHRDAEDLYRLERQWLSPDGSVRGGFASLAPSFVVFLEKEFPEIENAVRLYPLETTLVSVGDIHYEEKRFYFAEEDFFDVFSIALVEGDPRTALAEPDGLIISQSMAKKYFRDENPIGKQMELDQTYLFQVTGVMEDTPSNTHVYFDFIASYLALKGLRGSGERDYFHGTRNFSDNVTFAYARFAPGTDPDAVRAKIPGFMDRVLGTRKDKDGNIIRASQGNTIFLQRVTDIHLHSHTSKELEANGDIRYVNLFTIIAIFILIIACINFMNLSTARATQRAREVGLRKVVGANRRSLTGQFLGESLMVALLAIVLALGFVALLLPAFNAFSNRDIGFGLLSTPVGLLTVFGVFALTGIVSGFYPALYLSAFRPATILRGELTRGTRGALMRKVLVVFQFSISVALIVGVGVVYKQMKFLQDADLGFQRENIVMLRADQTIKQSWLEFKQQLTSSPNILFATLSKRAPTGRLLDSPGFRVELNGQMLNSPFSMPHNRVEYDFFKTYGMEIIAGRDFSMEFPTDANKAFILNETAVRRLGLERPEDAVGLPMRTIAPFLSGNVIGVVKDFNYESMHNEIIPIITYIQPIQANTVSIRIAAGRTKEALHDAEVVWNRFNPEYPFQYDFLDDRIAEQYRNEERMMQMFGYFSLLAIFIACLGLFGLASFMAEKRTKEIGIRKVLGASLSNIMVLLSREFTLLVLVGNFIAWPLAYFAMRAWLNNFAYQTGIGWVVFVLAGFLTLVISLLTVSYQAIRAALTDPVISLRYE
jgi:putative ABC transport system permease protein